MLWKGVSWEVRVLLQSPPGTTRASLARRGFDSVTHVTSHMGACVPLNCVPYFSFETGSLTEPGANPLGRSAGQQAQESHCLWTLHAGVTGMSCHTQIFMCDLGNQI